MAIEPVPPQKSTMVKIEGDEELDSMRDDRMHNTG
jgi:hypothetical protein